ncbi:TPA: hypothetical protein ACH3X1_001563 [Trebouxia sp. C0004]
MEEVLHGWLNKAGKRDATHDDISTWLYSQHQQTLQRLVMAFGKLAAVNNKLAAVSSPSSWFDLLHEANLVSLLLFLQFDACLRSSSGFAVTFCPQALQTPRYVH